MLKHAGVSVTIGVEGQAEFGGGNVVVSSSMQSSIVQGPLNPEQNVGDAVVM